MAFVVEGRLLCLVFCSTMASRTFACAILALRSSVYSNIRYDSIQCATFIIRSVCVVARFLSSGKEAGTSDLTSKAAKYSPASLPFQHRCIVTLDARGQTDPTLPGNSAMDSPAPYLANSKLVCIYQDISVRRCRRVYRTHPTLATTPPSMAPHAYHFWRVVHVYHHSLIYPSHTHSYLLHKMVLTALSQSPHTQSTIMSQTTTTKVEISYSDRAKQYAHFTREWQTGMCGAVCLMTRPFSPLPHPPFLIKLSGSVRFGAVQYSYVTISMTPTSSPRVLHACNVLS